MALLSSVQVDKVEPIFFIDYTPALPSIDSVLSLVKPAEQQPPPFASAESISTPISPSNEQIEAEQGGKTVGYPFEEQDLAESSSKAQEEELEDGSAEEAESEKLFSSSEEDDSDASSIFTITTTTTPSLPPSPRFNPSFERSTPQAEMDSPSPFASFSSTSHLDLKVSPSSGAQDINTWISLTTKPLRFNPSFERSPSPFAIAESPSPLAPATILDAPLLASAANSLHKTTTNLVDAPKYPEPLPAAASSTSERYPSFIWLENPSPRRRRGAVKRA